MQVLALSGSLRAASLNSLLLRVAARVAPDGVVVQVFTELSRLPLFNPDLEADLPAAVADLRDRILASDAVLMASPEYAHGVSGPMKNALDWMVGNDSFIDKPVAVLNASHRASIAHAALVETLVTMSARVVQQACVDVPLRGKTFTEAQLLADEIVVSGLRQALRALRAVQAPRGG
jgi:NAD(P)H-dependent FMN reductase